MNNKGKHKKYIKSNNIISLQNLFEYKTRNNSLNSDESIYTKIKQKANKQYNGQKKTLDEQYNALNEYYFNDKNKSIHKAIKSGHKFELNQTQQQNKIASFNSNINNKIINECKSSNKLKLEGAIKKIQSYGLIDINGKIIKPKDYSYHNNSNKYRSLSSLYQTTSFNGNTCHNIENCHSNTQLKGNNERIEKKNSRNTKSKKKLKKSKTPQTFKKQGKQAEKKKIKNNRLFTKKDKNKQHINNNDHFKEQIVRQYQCEQIDSQTPSIIKLTEQTAADHSITLNILNTLLEQTRQQELIKTYARSNLCQLLLTTRLKTISIINQLCHILHLRRSTHSLSIQYLESYIFVHCKNNNFKNGLNWNNIYEIGIGSLLIACKIDDHDQLSHLHQTIQKNNLFKQIPKISNIMSLQTQILTSLHFKLARKTIIHWSLMLTMLWNQFIQENNASMTAPLYNIRQQLIFQCSCHYNDIFDKFKCLLNILQLWSIKPKFNDNNKPTTKIIIILSVLYIILRIQIDKLIETEQSEPISKLLQKYRQKLSTSNNILFYDKIGINEYFASFLNLLQIDLLQLIPGISNIYRYIYYDQKKQNQQSNYQESNSCKTQFYYLTQLVQKQCIFYQ